MTVCTDVCVSTNCVESNSWLVSCLSVGSDVAFVPAIPLVVFIAALLYLLNHNWIQNYGWLPVLKVVDSGMVAEWGRKGAEREREREVQEEIKDGERKKERRE